MNKAVVGLLALIAWRQLLALVVIAIILVPLTTRLWDASFDTKMVMLLGVGCVWVLQHSRRA